MFKLHRRQAFLLALLPALCFSPALLRAQDTPASAAGTQAQPAAPAADSDNDQVLPAERTQKPVLWHEQKDIAGLDLFYGRGGPDHQPKPPFQFEKEDLNGTNPKFDAQDADGKVWRCKLGDESRPEVVASRLLWAVGYFANDDYLLPTADVAGLKMKRGGDLVKTDNLTDVRFSRKPGGQKKIGIWEWKQNPFFGTREFNGLRVMMAVMNNWDLKDVNNSVYNDSRTGEQLFLVNDVGATFGSNGLAFSKTNAKGNADQFEKSKFVEKVKDGKVSFGTPHAPKSVLLASFGGNFASYHMRAGLEWIGQDIPLADARWIGSLLGQLSHKQLVDAFRAGNFPAPAVEQYVSVVESRIAELRGL